MTSGSAPDWEAAGRVAGEGMADVVGTVADTHDAIGRRVEAMLPVGIRGFAAMHRRMTGRVYDRVQQAHRVIPAMAGRAAGDVPPAGADAVLPIVNGLWGDRLARREESLALPMSFRVGGRDVAPEYLAGANPREHLVIFVHGLCSSETDWRWERDGVDGNYGLALETDLDVTSLFVRYNTGLRISDNGRRLADLVEQAVSAWPVPVSRVSLVGHSMGGLVVRSACHYADTCDMAWPELVGHVVTLGTPHLGSPVEKSVHLADWLFGNFDETRPLGEFLRRRSVGVKDLRFGAVSEADWHGHDPDEFLRDRCQEVPLLANATYHWVSATLARDEDGLWAGLIGDGLVRTASASGRGRNRVVPLHRGKHITGAGHLALLRDEEVYDQLLQWLRGS